MANPGRIASGLRLVALYEGAKAAIVLVAGFGLLTAIHQGAARLAEELVRQMHLNPAQGYPRVFIDLTRDASNAQLWLFAAGAFGYAALRSVQAVGLWQQRRWAEWLSVASSGVYVPIELYEIARGYSAIKLTALLANVGIVVYMAYALRASRRSAGA
jgi:uncharacterized membrane protein (DUF2068 family)